MNVLYIGSGFVGACSAAVSAASGHNVLVYDIDEKKIEMLSSGDRDTIETCLFEEGLGDILVRNKERIEFTLDYNKVENFLDTCDGVFMCLPTPEVGETGESNLTYYFDAAEKLSEALLKRNNEAQDKYIVVINKSTVPIDMVTKTEEMISEKGVKNFGVVSNPEFLVEGKAIQGSLKPDRVVVGAWKEENFEVMRNIYERFYNSPTVSYIEVNPKEAAAGKLLANFYLTYKLMACYDVIGRTCEVFDDLKFEHLRNILVTDKRIGNWGFFDSLYAGGSCLVKDIRSLSHQLQSVGADVSLVNEIYEGNKRQLRLFIDRAKNEANFDWKDKKVALLGVAFKRDTNDIRNSPSIDIVNFLSDNKVAKVNIFDPAAMGYFKQVFPESEVVKYGNNESEVLLDCDVVIVSTDWPQFKSLGDTILKIKDKKPLIMDGRRMLQNQYHDLQNYGFDIIAVGSPFLKAKK
jgi:UDPglucose 6-dehydrogenase